MPVPGILGNDLVGKLVVPKLEVKDDPLPTNPTTVLEREQPYFVAYVRLH